MSLHDVQVVEEVQTEDSELLARLDSADTMASGVEAKLDEILGTLDALLTSLEKKESDKPQEDALQSMLLPAN